MTIDKKTGLPEAPEGYIWRVKYGHQEIEVSPGTYWVGDLPIDYTKLVVHLVRKWTDVSTRSTGRWLWRKTETLELEREQVVESKLCEGTHPVAVLNAANHIANKLAARRLSGALIGDYPPKTLPEATNA